MEQMGKRCEEMGLVQETGGAGGTAEQWCRQAQMMGELKENHIFGEFENIVRVVGPRLESVGVRCWRT